MIKFEKISYEQFLKDYVTIFGDEVPIDEIKKMYDNVKLPKRSTKGSAGYDFFTPISFRLEGNADIVIPTGIRCYIDNGKFLQLVPRSGLGMKHYLRIANTLGVIDEDYVFAKNEGHIMAKIRLENHVEDSATIHAGEKFMQGIFVQYFVTDDDDADGERTGGFGSTGR